MAGSDWLITHFVIIKRFKHHSLVTRCESGLLTVTLSLVNIKALSSKRDCLVAVGYEDSIKHQISFVTALSTLDFCEAR